MPVGLHLRVQYVMDRRDGFRGTNVVYLWAHMSDSKKINGLKNSIFPYIILRDRHNMYLYCLYFGHKKVWTVRLALIRSPLL